MQLLNLNLLSKRKQQQQPSHYSSSISIKSVSLPSSPSTWSPTSTSTFSYNNNGNNKMMMNNNRSSILMLNNNNQQPSQHLHHHLSFADLVSDDDDGGVYRTLNLVKDQYDNIASHTNKSIDLLDKYGQFTRDLAAVEIDYASKLRRLAKNYQIKRKDEEDNMCTVIKAFNKSLKEITDIAGQHEIIAEELSLNIVKEIGTVLKELKDERKRYLQEGTKLQNSLQHTITMLEKSKRSYEKAYRESEKAHDNYLKADADLNLSRAEVEKARLISLSKSSMCDDAKSDYNINLERTNKLQRQHYAELMPRVFHQLQDMEERRSQCIRNYIMQCAQIRQKVLPIVEKCIEGMIEASELIDPKEDSRLVIDKYKSGVEPPGDFPLEDLSNRIDSISNGDSSDGASVHSSNGSSGTGPYKSSSLHYSKSVCSETFRGTLSASKFRKRGGIFGIFSSSKSGHDESKEDYSDLPPNQRRKRLQSKIDLIQSNIQQEIGVREALLKMRQVYQENPKLGDHQMVNSQLNECIQKIEKLEIDLKKYQTMLSSVVQVATTPGCQKKSSISLSSSSQLSSPPSIQATISNNTVATNGQPTTNNGNHRNSISDNSNDSVSRSESETSLHNHSNGSNGSYGASSLMQAANSLFSKYAIASSANSANSSSPSTTNTAPSVINETTQNSNYPFSGHKTTNGSKATTPTTNGNAFLFTNGKAKSDQDLSLDANIENDDQATSSPPVADEDDFEEPLMALGTAKALYAFEGQDEGSIDMAEGEEFELIELDQGDGWTRVRRLKGDCEEGFVPTTYVECSLYENET